jgi:hypothetical protein
MSNLLDLSDPFDAHAYLILAFSCDDCRADLSPDEDFKDCDDVYCRHIADKAKALGWYVGPPAPPDARTNVQMCYCPDCARRRRRRA